MKIFVLFITLILINGYLIAGDSLKVINVLPVPQLISAEPSATIEVQFNMRVDPSSFSDTTFMVWGRWSGVHKGILDFNSIGNIAYFYPDDDFFFGEMISVSLSKGIKDEMGNNLSFGYAWNELAEMKWVNIDGGIYEIGNDGNEFCYDNETPRHKDFLNPFMLANRLVTNGEFLEFIEDGGYEKAPLWLSDGWAIIESEKWKAPFYWEKKDSEWWNFTLNGFRKVNPKEPVTHISYYEVDAFAAWRDLRLPTEAEWEVASRKLNYEGNFVDKKIYHPTSLRNEKDGLNQMYGDVWEWTRSSYSPYPGYNPLPGALGEYNGKFMSSQMVLRGGSCATSQSHIRNTYRNFFPPHSRWQFMGLRLAKDV